MPSPYLYIKGDSMATEFLYLKNVTLKHCTGSDYSTAISNVISTFPEDRFVLAYAVDDDQYNTIYSSLSSGGNIIDNNGNPTSLYNTLLSYIPNFTKRNIYGNLSDRTIPAANLNKIINLFGGRYFGFASYVTGQQNSCIIPASNEYSFGLEIPNVSSLTGIYQNGTYISSSSHIFGGIVGYTGRTQITIINKSLTKYFTIWIDPSGDYSSIRISLHSSDSINTNTRTALQTVGYIGELKIDDPYFNGGTSTSGGGHGDFDSMTDSMSEPSYDPVESYNRGYANHGFAKVYLPTSAQLLSLHNYLWSSSLDNTLKKMYASPIDCIISLNMIPLDLSSILGDPVNQQNIVIGNVDTQIENVNVPYTQFIMLDCGTISISEFFGSYLDYSPYTKLSIYLPYIGMKELDIDDFMNGEIGVKYYIDIVSGDCVAYINQVNLSSNDVRPAIAGGAGVLYQFTGNVAFNVPISAQNFSQIYAASAGAMIGGAGLLASALSGGLSAPMALTGIAATGVNVATSKPTISRGGSIPSTSGYLGIQVPYLILTRPRQCLPEDQNALVGYPAYITVTIEDIEGYNEFEIVHLENIPATDAEKAEIEKLLKSGVIL